MKYKFICEHENMLCDAIDSRITYETDHDNAEMIIEDFRQFLIGCGFSEQLINSYIEPQ